MKVLFLYTELAEYSMACFKALKRASPDCELMVVHFPINPEAPFKFAFEGLGTFISISRFDSYESFASEIKKFAPDKIVCSGWINKWYVRFCTENFRKATGIVCSDNLWRGSLKQKLLGIIAPVTLRRTFQKIWIPGEPQVKYAKKLGFDDKEIMRGFYSCDVDRFKAYHEQHKSYKAETFPKRFLCVARYIPAKGYEHLWKAFVEWKKRRPNDWELWCAGTGEDFQKRMIHPAIRHLGFVQKDEWDDVIRNTGVFVLPSLFEPWGVAVHEFAAAGYPLLVSERVGSGTAFVNSRNGFKFDPTDIEQIISCLDQVNALGTEDLLEMGRESLSLAEHITPASWSQVLLSS